MLLSTERRVSQDMPGAMSRRSVGSMSSAATRLKNRVSLSALWAEMYSLLFVLLELLGVGGRDGVSEDDEDGMW